MTAGALMRQLASTLDEHRWGDLPGLLHAGFTCRLVHTGETFDRDGWVRFNADYPGFQHFVLEDCVATATRAVGRAHVTGLVSDVVRHFEVATFLTVRDGLIGDVTEVWADVDPAAPGAPARRSPGADGTSS